MYSMFDHFNLSDKASFEVFELELVHAGIPFT